MEDLDLKLGTELWFLRDMQRIPRTAHKTKQEVLNKELLTAIKIRQLKILGI